MLAASGASSAGSTASSGSSTAPSSNASGAPGLLCLSVHEDGALAAGGCNDGRVLIWDMRKVTHWLQHTPGHNFIARLEYLEPIWTPFFTRLIEALYP